MLLLAVLFPIAIYLAFLGWINRRPRGMLVSGPWDFAGILFAASGFLLFGAPALLSSFSRTDTWRSFWVLGKLTRDAPLDERGGVGRALLFGTYFLLVVVGAVFLLWRRRRLTSIYNVDPALVETVLGHAFERLNLPFIQTGNVLLIDPDLATASSADSSAEDVPVASPTPHVLVERVITLEVEASLGMCHVTLWWDPPDSLLRREIEAQLRLALAQRDPPGGPVGDWLLVASSSLFFLLLIGAGVLALQRFLPH